MFSDCALGWRCGRGGDANRIGGRFIVTPFAIRQRYRIQYYSVGGRFWRPRLCEWGCGLRTPDQIDRQPHLLLSRIHQAASVQLLLVAKYGLNLLKFLHYCYIPASKKRISPLKGMLGSTLVRGVIHSMLYSLHRPGEQRYIARAGFCQVVLFRLELDLDRLGLMQTLNFNGFQGRGWICGN
jgi:hypothetical protein